MKAFHRLVAILMSVMCSIPPAHSAQGASEANTIRVMTFNIWGDGKSGKKPLSQTAKVIRMANADVVGLQEIHKNAKPLADMLGWSHVQQRRGVAVLSRFEIVGTTEERLGVKIRTDSGQVIFVFNMHLMHAPYQPYQLLGIPYHNAPFLKTAEEAVAAARKARGGAVRSLLKEINGIQNKTVPVFITGDFNEPSHLDWTQTAASRGRHPIEVAYPTSSELASAGFVDVYRAVHPDEIKKPGYTWTPRTEPTNPRDHHDRIDFVLCSQHSLKIEDAEVVGENQENADIVVDPYPSDHRAVVATFTFNGAANRRDADGSK